VAFPLHPETPEEGRSLEDLFRGRLVDIAQMKAQMKQVAQEAGLPFGDRKMTFNSRLAQELGKWAELEGKGADYHNSLFHAYFADGKNIAKDAILLELIKSIGLSSQAASDVLKNRTFQPAVDADWSRSQSLGITGVPTLALNGQHLVGAQPYSAMKAFLEDHSIAKLTN
jgi:predicted DsbA family dithiol-disulfide isomerase